VSRKDLRLDGDRYARVRVRCALPRGERCVSVLKASTSRGDAVGTVRVKVRAGKHKQVRFRLTDEQARRLDRAGVLRLDVRATVTRSGKYKIQEPRTRVLVLPPR